MRRFLRTHTSLRLLLGQIEQVYAFILFECIEHWRLCRLILSSYFWFESEHGLWLQDFLPLHLIFPFFTKCWSLEPFQSGHRAFFLLPCGDVLRRCVYLWFEFKRILSCSYFFCFSFIFYFDLEFSSCLFYGTKGDSDSVQVLVWEKQIT
jgi:hypothetical protein